MTEGLQHRLQTTLAFILRVRLVVFLLFVAIVCGFTAWRAYSLANAPVPASAVTSKLSATATPHVDQATIDKVDQLQDNSVSVRTLFNQARQNPFQE